MDYKLYAGVCLIDGNKILLTQQSSEADQSGKWGLPAGHIEDDETPQQGAIREAKEEIGVDIVLTGLVQVVILRRPKKEDALVVIYKGSLKSNQKPEVDGKEVSSYAWVAKDDIEKNRVEWRHPFFKRFVLKSFGRKINMLDGMEIIHSKI